ncbi:hypothetical protein AAFF_G00284250 [Aldrovandia affinis]|uniref:Uncharacterized protein n=1 Tax=Aldrovandia affinis TaxID=143900 RepID=A0AAD7TBD7_9TELE|nr:hypothetical protein AAFF_G00284250 [Aldrovandia affinis]
MHGQRGGPASVMRQHIKNETELLARGGAADGCSSEVLRGSDSVFYAAAQGPLGPAWAWPLNTDRPPRDPPLPPHTRVPPSATAVRKDSQVLLWGLRHAVHCFLSSPSFLKTLPLCATDHNSVRSCTPACSLEPPCAVDIGPMKQGAGVCLGRLPQGRREEEDPPDTGTGDEKEQDTLLTASLCFLSAEDLRMSVERAEAEITASLTHSPLPWREKRTAGCLPKSPSREGWFTGHSLCSKCTRSLRLSQA